MNSYIKKACLAVTIFASASPIIAQNTASGYFLDNYTYRYQLNPAYGNGKGFVSMPAIGNLNVGLRGNLNLSDIIYTENGKTVLFTNPNISTSEVMGNISDKNKISANIKENILSVGFSGFKGYNTISINAVANVNALIPRSLISLAKEGVANNTYDISDFQASANAYTEIALNHSHNIKAVPGLRIGATAKVLIGIGNIDAYFNKAQLNLSDNSWTATTNANIYNSVNGLLYKHDVNDNTGHTYISGADYDSFKLNGFGLAFDLGATYHFKDWSISAAILDLGFISWNKTYLASTNGDQTFNTDAYTFNANDDADNSFENEFDRFKDDLASLYELNDNGDIGTRSKMLAATTNIGAQYELPAYRKLHFGLLNTTHINGKFTWTEFRLSANIHPAKVISADANVVCGTYGIGFGWLLNLHLTGFNLFAGMDRTTGKLAKQGVPLHSNTQVNFGLNFPF
jgi:hypothetical protein